MPDAITHQPLEGQVATYASAIEGRRQITAAIRRRLLEVADALAPALREAAAAERDARDALEASIKAAPALFAKPRTRTVHGIKYGWQTGKPSIVVPDEARACSLIRRYAPADLREQLLVIKESVSKTAALGLPVGQLQRYAIEYRNARDSVVVKPVADLVDDLVAALLHESAQEAADA